MIQIFFDFSEWTHLIALKLGCRSVAYTYNDPIIFHEYAIDVAKECRKLGIKSVAVTAGYVNDEPRREFFSYMDAANVDLKAFTERFYHKLAGGHLQPVLVNKNVGWVGAKRKPTVPLKSGGFPFHSYPPYISIRPPNFNRILKNVGTGL